MSHNIELFDYSEKVNRKAVQKELDHYAAMEDWQEGCQGLYRDIRWIESPVYANYDEASKAIDKLDRGDYDQLAVKYHYYHPPRDDKTEELKRKVLAAGDEYRKRDSAVYPRTVTSAMISCKKCGSKLAREYLRTNFCPVCRTDMRPEYIMKSIQAAKNKMLRAEKEVSDYYTKKGKKEVRWLVKIEYHT